MGEDSDYVTLGAAGDAPEGALTRLNVTVRAAFYAAGCFDIQVVVDSPQRVARGTVFVRRSETGRALRGERKLRMAMYLPRIREAWRVCPLPRRHATYPTVTAKTPPLGDVRVEPPLRATQRASPQILEVPRTATQTEVVRGRALLADRTSEGAKDTSDEGFVK